MPEEFQSSKKRSHRRTHLLLGAVGVVGAILIAAGIFGEQNENDANAPIARLARKTGEVRINRTQTTGHVKYQPGLHVLPGDYLRTKSKSTLTVEYLHDDTTLRLQPKTKVQICSTKGGKNILVRNGSVKFSVPDQPKEEPLKCTTTNAAATVLQPGNFTLTFKDLKSTFELHGGQLRIRKIANGEITTIQGETTHVCQPEGSGKIEFGTIDTSFDHNQQ